MKVKFEADKEVLNHKKQVVADFREGRVYDLVDSSARYWVGRGFAHFHKGDEPVSDHTKPGDQQEVDPLAGKTAASGSPAGDGQGSPSSSSAPGQASGDPTSSGAGAGGEQSPSTGQDNSAPSQTSGTAATPAGGDKPAAKPGKDKKDKKAKA